MIFSPTPKEFSSIVQTSAAMADGYHAELSVDLRNTEAEISLNDDWLREYTRQVVLNVWRIALARAREGTAKGQTLWVGIGLTPEVADVMAMESFIAEFLGKDAPVGKFSHGEDAK